MKRLLAFVAVILLAGLLGGMLGCKGRAKSPQERDASPPKAMQMVQDEAQAVAGTRESAALEKASPSEPSPDALSLPATRMVIKTAALYIRVRDVDKAYSEALKLVEASDGYVQSGTLSETEGARADIIIKIKPEGFLGLVTELEKLGAVESKNISGQDVTEEYYDLAAELENALEVRQRFFELLRKASDVDEAIRVEQELERVGSNINRIKGRMKYLETMTDESTINLTLYGLQRPKPEPFLNWSKVGHGFVVAAQVLVKILIGILYALVVLIPLAAIVLLVIWAVIRIVRARKTRKARNTRELKTPTP